MALPPNEFKDLLVGSDGEIYETLREKRLLSRRGLKHREAVIGEIQESAQRFSKWVQENPGCTGPNQQDRLAESLLASRYVNAKAKRMAANRLQWWKFWQK